MVLKSQRLTHIFRIVSILICLMAAGLILYVWVEEEIAGHRDRMKRIRATCFENQKEILRTQVRQTVGYISRRQARAEIRVRENVKARTREAWDTAWYIWRQNRDTLPLPMIKKMVHDALFAVSWDNGSGYYFAEDMAGIEMINRNDPGLEGRNVTDFQDSNGICIMKAFIAVAGTEEKEGFVSYSYPKPGNPGKDEPKVSYIKYFEPFDWVLGNGKYIVDEEKIIKKAVIRHLEQTGSATGNGLFIGTWDGSGPMDSLQGRNLFGRPDAKGADSVRNIISLAKSGGGFITYDAHRGNGAGPSRTIGYIEPVPGWQWYVGADIRIDDIQSAVTDEQNRLKERLRVILRKCLLVPFLLFLAVFCMARELADARKAEKKKEARIRELEIVLERAGTLGGLLSICSSCRKIRDDSGQWKKLESYIESRTQAVFSQGLCPDCMERRYSGRQWYTNRKKHRRN